MNETQSKIWITSDWHFGHDKDFIYKPRGFTSVDESNEEIILRHNEVVDKNDLVYFLGDAMLNDNEKGIECIKRLNGRIVMIRGNHDTDARIKLYSECPNVIEVGDWAKVIKYRKKSFYLSHYPTCVGNGEETHGPWCLCGHTHTVCKYLDFDKRCFHIEMDTNDCYPWLLDDIIENIRKGE